MSEKLINLDEFNLSEEELFAPVKQDELNIPSASLAPLPG